ncbi:MAG: glutamine--fructose-6-phosphate transaminase (isomerizing) [Paludibacteraceae bacterium]|nr:glutamine--fructose-6-phosphate transaminase (isomerizing) [Paludibacteraceae bacterium]
MCGIVGYIGSREAYPILIKGLKRLEYRGYDSAGVALLGNSGRLNVYKSTGKVSDLEHTAAGSDLSGHIGIAHTRWATHGAPTDVNAHPHVSASGNIALIHNGIIENYAVLKDELTRLGYTFKSQTDTEVLVQLIDYIMQDGGKELCQAVMEALTHVEGAYAIAVIDAASPDRIVVARKSSPLVIGIGDGEFFLASDASPIVEYTNKVVYLADGEIATLDLVHGLTVTNLDNMEHTPEVQTLKMSLSQLEKGGYPHFMLKEIYEQPRTLRDCMRGRISEYGNTLVLSGVEANKDKFLNAKRIVIVGCGTSWHAALIGEHLIEDLCRIPVEVEYASEFRYRNPVISSSDVVIAISQSGETADTLAAVELAHKNGAFVYGICNAVGSSIPRATDSGSYIHVGPEIGVASTKAFTGQVTVLTMLALSLAKLRGTISESKFTDIISELRHIPEKMERAIEMSENLSDISKVFTYVRNFIYLGRGYNYPAAMEGALKLKEISYIHAEGYPAAEMKHGPIALIDAEMPVVAIANSDSVYDKTVSNVQEIKARGGKVIAVVDEGDTKLSKMADIVMYTPKTLEMLSPLLSAIPLQLLAYHIAVSKGRDVDQPRNLAKSVTVE